MTHRRPSSPMPTQWTSKPIQQDTVEAAASREQTTQLLVEHAKRWVTGDCPEDLIATMTADGVAVACLPVWQRGWVPAVLSLLGFSSERILPNKPTFGLVCILLKLLGVLSANARLADGFILLRRTPTVHTVLIHGYHLLAARAGLSGYAAVEQQALTAYLAWQQRGQAVPMLEQQGAVFLRNLQPALARHMEALSLLHTLCETVLSPAYEAKAFANTGSLMG